MKMKVIIPGVQGEIEKYVFPFPAQRQKYTFKYYKDFYPYLNSKMLHGLQSVLYPL